MKSTTKNTYIKLLSLLSLTLSLPVLAADDGKRYSGTYCQSNSSAVLYQSNGRAGNNSSTSTINVVCPAIKDKINGVLTKNNSIYVLDQNPGANVRCVFRTLDSTQTDGYAFFSTRNSNGASSTPQLMTFSNRTILAAQGHIATTCTLPSKSTALSDRVDSGRSSVVSYAVTEQ